VTGRVHNFRDSLAWSEQQGDSDMWELVYRDVFPDFNNMTKLDGHTPGQLAGIDRFVTLRSGAVLRIDEKKDAHGSRNFFLEYWSSYEDRAKGWIVKELLCDYIAYAFPAAKRAYVLPFQQLRKAWQTNGRAWTDGRYLKPRVSNESKHGGQYTTVGVCVPVPVVLEAIKGALSCSWEQAGLPFSVLQLTTTKEK
jgi:hypothetical protein